MVAPGGRRASSRSPGNVRCKRALPTYPRVLSARVTREMRVRDHVVEPPDVIARIVEQNLGAYRAMPSRLQEDVSQESQVASDYRGRLVYELLQNADDAMADASTTSDRVSFLVTDDELWIANTGRALTDADVLGLCGLGASSKVDAAGNRRASIGHKGLGFKSVL